MSIVNKSVAAIFADALNSYEEFPEFWDLPIDDTKTRSFVGSGKLFVPKCVRDAMAAPRTYSVTYASFEGIYALPKKSVSCDTTNYEALLSSKLSGSPVPPVTTVTTVAPVALVTTVTPATSVAIVANLTSVSFPKSTLSGFIPTARIAAAFESGYSIQEIRSMFYPAGPAVSGCTELAQSVPEPAVEIISDSNSGTTSPDPSELPIPSFLSNSSIFTDEEDLIIEEFLAKLVKIPDIITTDFPETYSDIRTCVDYSPADPTLCFWALLPFLTPTGQLKFYKEHKHYTAAVSAFTIYHFLSDFGASDYAPSFIKVYFGKLHLVTDVLIPRVRALKFLYSNRFSTVGYTELWERILDQEKAFPLSYMYNLLNYRIIENRRSERIAHQLRKKIRNTIRIIKTTNIRNDFADELALREGIMNFIPGSASATSILDKASSLLSEIPAGALSSLISTATTTMDEGNKTIKNASIVLDFFASIVTYMRDIQKDARLALDYLQSIIEKVFTWLGDFFPEDSLVPLILKSITPHDATYTFFWIVLVAILLWNIIFGGKHLNKLIIIILLIAVPFLSHFNILNLIIEYISSLSGDNFHDCVNDKNNFFDAQEEFATREMFNGDWSKPLILLLSSVTFIGAKQFVNMNSWMSDMTASQAKFSNQFSQLFNGYKSWNTMIDSLVTDAVDEWTKFDTTLFGLTGVLAEEVRADFVRLDQIEHWPNRESLYSDPDFHDELLRISERIRKYSHETDRVRFPARFNERLIKADRLLTNFISESTKRKGQEDNFRFDPIHTSFYGEPGVGKSFLVNVMIHDILDFFGKPKLNRIFYRNPAVPFFSGYCGQHAMMIDDANSLKTDLDAIDSLQLKSSVPHQVNMAAIPDKGRMFTSEFIFSTTNEKLFTVSRDIKFSGAVNRRRDILIEVEKDGEFEPNPTRGKRFFILNPLDGNRISEGMDYFELMMTLLPFYQEMYNVRKQATVDMNECKFSQNWRELLSKFEGSSGQTKFNYKDSKFRIVTHKCIEKDDLAQREMADAIEVTPEDPMLNWAMKIVEVQPNFYMIADPADAEEFLSFPDEDQKRVIYYYKNYCQMVEEGEKIAQMRLTYAREMGPVNQFIHKVRVNEDEEFVYPENDTYFHVLFDNMSAVQKFVAFEILKHKYKYESLHEARRLGWLETEVKEVAKPFLSMLSPATKCTIGAIAGTAITYGVLSFIKGWTAKGKPVEKVKVDNEEQVLVEDDKPIISEARVRRTHKQPKDPYSNEKVNRDPNVKKIVFEGRTFEDKCYYFKKGGGVKNFDAVTKDAIRVLSCTKDNKYLIPRGDYQIRDFKCTFKFDSIILAKRDFKFDKFVFLAEDIRSETLLTKSVEFPEEIEILESDISTHLRLSSTLYDIDETLKKQLEDAQREGTVDPAGWEFGFKKIFNNTGYITSRFGSMHIIMIGPNRAILPKHFFFYKREQLENGAAITLQIKETIYEFKYYENEVVMHPDRDIAIWEIPSSIPHFPSLRKYIGSGEEAVKNADLKGVMMPAFRDVAFGRLILHVGHTSNVGPNFTTRKYSLRGMTPEEAAFDDMVYILKGHEYFMNTTPGDCGAALVGLNPDLTQKLIGIHIAGYHKGDSRGYSEILNIEKLEKLEQILNDRFWKGKYPHNVGPPPVEKLLASGCMRAPKFKPDMRNQIVDTGFMREMDCPTIPDKSAIIHSELYGLTGYDSVRDNAVLSIDDPRNVERIEPLLEGIKKYEHDGVNLPKRDLNIIADYLGELIKNQIGKQRDGFGKVSADVAVNGLAFEDYMEGLNMKTSAGWPFCLKIKTKDGKKSMFTVVGEQSNGAPLYEMCDELREAVQHKYDCVCAGAKSASLFFECLKDERLKPKKINPVKTRLFSIADVATIIVSRMFMLDFCVAMMKNREKLGPQVGINCDSPQWDHLFARLKANSPYGFACDYSAFDSTQDGTVLDAACRVMNSVCDTGDRDALARATLFNEMYSRLTIVGSKVVLLRRGLASGVSVTAIVNSIVNEIYIRFAWMHLARQYAKDLISQENFDEYVVGVYYGDDNVISVKPEVRDWFNLRTIATFLRKYGIIMTDAKKNDLSNCEEYEDVDNLTFLKREFKVDPDTGFVFAPLEQSSIEERPQWTRKKLGVFETLDNVRTSLRDAMHHGETYFNDLRERLRNACQMAKIGPFPTMSFGDLYQEFCDKRQEGKIVSSNVCNDIERTDADFSGHVIQILKENPEIIGFQELIPTDVEVLRKLVNYDLYENKNKYNLVTLIRKDLNGFQVSHPNNFEAVFDCKDGMRFAHCHFKHEDTNSRKEKRIEGLLKKGVDIIFGDLYCSNIHYPTLRKAVADKTFVNQIGSSPDSAYYRNNCRVKVLDTKIAFGIDKKGLSDHKYVIYGYGFQKRAD